MCPLFFPAQQYVASIKRCSGQAGGTGAHPSPVAGLCRAVPSSCSMPRGSCPQDPKRGLLPFCQDTLNPKGKEKWQERGQKGLQGLWALPRAQGCSFCRGWELESLFPVPSPARAGESQGAAATLIYPPVAWPGLRQSTDPPCFSRKTESQSSTVLPLLSRCLCWSRLAQGSVLRSCSFPLEGGKNGSQMEPQK